MTTATATAPAKPVKEAPKPEWIKLDEIIVDLEIQQRAGWSAEDNGNIKAYAEAMKDGAKFPPCVVFEDAKNATRMADGFTRYHAAELAGKDKLLCVVLKGTKSDAIWYACSANAKHGQQRTVKDKQRSVETALLHPKSKGMSDRAIAIHCGVSNVMVSNLRKELEEAGKTTVAETRTTTDGAKVKADAAAREKKVEAGKKSAAAKAAAKPAPAKPKSDGKVLTVNTSEGDIDADDPEAPAKPTGVSATVAKKPAVEVRKATAPIKNDKTHDADGKEVTGDLAAVFKKVGLFHQISNSLKAIASHWDALVKHPAGCFLGEHESAVLIELANAVEAACPKKVNAKYTNGWEPNNISKVDRNKDYKDGE